MGTLPLVMHVCGNVLYQFLDVTTEVKNFDKGSKEKNLSLSKNANAKMGSATQQSNSMKSIILLGLIAVNLPIGLYASLVHQRGSIDVMTFLYKEAQKPSSDEMKVMFLMPCHSTPYYRFEFLFIFHILILFLWKNLMQV
jgi:hypothetical protein